MKEAIIKKYLIIYINYRFIIFHHFFSIEIKELRITATAFYFYEYLKYMAQCLIENSHKLAYL